MPRHTASRNQRSWLTTTSARDGRRAEVCGEPADHLDVEMVGRLVQHQHFVPGQQHLGQRHPATLTTRQSRHIGVQIDPGQQMLDDRAGSGSAAQMWSGRPPTITLRTVASGREIVGPGAGIPPTGRRCE